MSKKMQSIRS